MRQGIKVRKKEKHGIKPIKYDWTEVRITKKGDDTSQTIRVTFCKGKIKK